MVLEIVLQLVLTEGTHGKRRLCLVFNQIQKVYVHTTSTRTWTLLYKQRKIPIIV